jgi:hypothetical protein
MLQAIQTRYFGPRNVKGSRIKATSASGISKTRPYDHALTPDENHCQAAEDLQNMLGWDGKMVCGVLPNGDRAFVFVEEFLQTSRRASTARL